MLRVRATPTLGDTGLALGSPPREYQKAACHGHTITSDQGDRWARGQRKDKPGIQEACRARKTNEMVNTPEKGSTRSFPSCTSSDHKAHQPQTSATWASRALEVGEAQGNSPFPFSQEESFPCHSPSHQEIDLLPVFII